ncbi:dihydrofolate reductase [Pedobacter yulinensis]|uniref:Dihydrofolate reductase n=1 Tax=Pedobacter yulinensis TaxID=2126353 RepID=A0A2T3HL03_9SPHI|nr:dihydrofolate reductase family protein [Pedobacter yulinensis]PST83104.1 dihydrofolate reductase [Pedobacter yulinensis]
MRKLIMKMSVSVDGFVCDAEGGKDWLFSTADSASMARSLAGIRQAGLILLGRKTFVSIARYWPAATGPFAAPMNEIPKAVFTKNGFSGLDFRKSEEERSPAEVSWATARIFDGDLARAVSRLKAEPGKPIVALGGGGLMQSLVATGLIDEYQLFVHPVVLGNGLPVFNRLQKPLYLKPAEVEVFPGGTIAMNYRM